jgi:hypothetical protein
MIFDTIEVITLVIMLIAFGFIMKAYLFGVQTAGSKKLWQNFLIVGGLIVLNRIFTNVEVLAWKSGFNFLEHLSMALAGIVFVYVAWTAKKEVGHNGN